MERKITREVNVGGVAIGGGKPVVIQSMCNTDTRDIAATSAQILRLEDAGCEMIRVAVPDMEAAEAIAGIKKNIHIPLVADIHFDYRLALRCIENGIDKVRINPGNIGSRDRVKLVADAAKANGIPIRIGVNGGSLEKEFVRKYGGATAEALVQSAMGHAEILDDVNFSDIVVSIKVSSVPVMIDAYRMFSQKCDIPLHVGVTESGTERMGTIKSSIGIGTLLSEGIGDTIRVSLTADPVREIYAAKDILRTTGLREGGIEFVSCPTCGRTQIDLIRIASEVERRIEGIDKSIKVAVMGCIVNGPGEARDADIGIAGGKGEGLIFKKGEILRKIPESEIVNELIKEIERL